MREIGSALRVKYKLAQLPTDEQAAQWADLAEQLIEEGNDPEDAGRVAAERLFVIVKNLILKAEADTIQSLLEQAKKK